MQNSLQPSPSWLPSSNPTTVLPAHVYSWLSEWLPVLLLCDQVCGCYWTYSVWAITVTYPVPLVTHLITTGCGNTKSQASRVCAAFIASLEKFAAVLLPQEWHCLETSLTSLPYPMMWSPTSLCIITHDSTFEMIVIQPVQHTIHALCNTLHVHKHGMKFQH